MHTSTRLSQAHKNVNKWHFLCIKLLFFCFCHWLFICCFFLFFPYFLTKQIATHFDQMQPTTNKCIIQYVITTAVFDFNQFNSVHILPHLTWQFNKIHLEKKMKKKTSTRIWWEKKLIKTITISNAIIRLTKFTMQYTSGWYCAKCMRYVFLIFLFF